MRCFHENLIRLSFYFLIRYSRLHTKTDDAIAFGLSSATPNAPSPNFPKEKYTIETERYLLTFEASKDILVRIESDQAWIGMLEPDND